MTRIVNPSSELYVDGRFYFEEAEKQTNQFLKWRYLRASLLTSYYALEATINVYKNIDESNREKLDEKWKDQFDCNQPIENKHWNIFKEIKKVREAIAHFNMKKEEKSVLMYLKLDIEISKYLETVRYMMLKIFEESTINEWEKNTTPLDLQENIKKSVQ